MGKGQDLLNAARAGDKWTVEKIIGILTKRSGPFTNFSLRKCGLNVQDDNGYTPLHHACLNGHTEVVRLLLSAGASPAVVDKTGASPLHLAAWKGDSAIVTMLLAHNPPVNIDLVTADLETPLIMAAQYGSVNVVAQLVDRGADVTLRNVKDESALDLAAQYGRLPTVKHLLATHPTLVHQYKYPKWKVHKFYSTPLHRAAKNGHVEVVQVLLAAGIDPNIRTSSGTPLHEAACFGKASVVRILLEAGADLNEVDGRDKTVEELLADYSEEATRRVRRAIREFKNSSRNNYESEEEPRPFSIQDCSPTSYPHIPVMCTDTDMAFKRQSNAADNALTNPDMSDIKRVSNAKIKATFSHLFPDDWSLVRQSLQTNNPNHLTYMNKIQSLDRNESYQESPKYSNTHNRISSFFNLWKDKSSISYTRQQSDIYQNIVEPSYNMQGTQFNTSQKKKPKPPPKPNVIKNTLTHNEIIYENIPDDIKLLREQNNEGVEEKSRFYYEKYARKSFSGIYTSMDSPNKISPDKSPLKSQNNRFSISSGSLYVDMNPKFKKSESSGRYGCHFRGSIGCIYDDIDQYYSIYELKPEAMRNNEYPFERTKRKFDRLPCFCHRNRNERKSCEIFYSCENFNQADVGNRSDDTIVEELNEQIDFNAMTFEPFEEDNLSIKQIEKLGKTDRVKNVFAKKINQLAQLLVDWDSEK